MHHVRATGATILVTPLDLDTIDTETPDGAHIRGQVDPSTGLVMASDHIHVPVSVIIGTGPDVSHAELVPGMRIVSQRLHRDGKHASTFELSTDAGNMVVHPIRTAGRCICGGLIPTDSVAAVVDTRDGAHRYQAVGARILVIEDEAPTLSDIIVGLEREHGELTWGRVYSLGSDALEELHDGCRVAYRTGTGTTWTDHGTTCTSLRGVRRCDECGRIAHGGDVLAVESC